MKIISVINVMKTFCEIDVQRKEGHKEPCNVPTKGCFNKRAIFQGSIKHGFMQ